MNRNANGIRGIAASSSAEEQTAILYCISYNELNKARYIKNKQIVWELKFHYLHATDMQNARYEFIMSRPNKSIQGFDIVGIAPVIGYHVEDNKGDKLSV
jgi:hypothetical protein